MDLKPYFQALLRSSLFRGMNETGLDQLLHCIDAQGKRLERNNYFIMQGDNTSDIFIIVEGRAVGERVQSDGQSVTVGEFQTGDVFGDVLSGSSMQSVVSVRATEPAVAVHFSFEDILTCCADAHDGQVALLRNLTNAIADKYFALNERVMILAHTSLRGKIAGYLLELARRGNGGDHLVSPHNREEMARYLGCERSALSREISRMAREGLFESERRSFVLKDREALAALAD